MINIKNYIKEKILIILLIGICIVSINTIIQAKYVISNEFCVANLNIDRTKPKVELVSITNSNKSYEFYANKTHTITTIVKFTDKNLEDIFCDKEHIKVKIDDEYVNIQDMAFTKIKDLQEEKIYQIEVKGIEENGNFKLEIAQGTAVDMSGLQSDKIELDTKILIDNVAPKGEVSESVIPESGGKVNLKIKLNENIENLEGWKFSEDKLTIEKEFTNNISYELPIVDYAGNKSIININVTKATCINIIYASHNSEVGWSFGYGNYDAAGSKAIEENPTYKTEALAFNVSGDIESDFLQARAYVYTHWGVGNKGICYDSGLIYDYGYNPSDGTYKSMKSSDLVTIGDKKYFQLGGSGINGVSRTDINGNNPISKEISLQYPYGICGISIKLKDYSQFSVVYQILVNGIGWISTCSDGQECMYSKEKPMSVFRIALIPKSEKQYVIDTWNKDIGTYNVKDFT